MQDGAAARSDRREICAVSPAPRPPTPRGTTGDGATRWTDPAAPPAATVGGVLRLGEDGHEEGASGPQAATGIRGFDHVSMGGLPARRATVVAGQAGSAKTVFAAQFLAEGVRRG